MSSRPMARITVGEAYYDLIDNYESLKNAIEGQKPEDLVEVTRWDNGKKMTIRIGSIDTLQQAGY